MAITVTKTIPSSARYTGGGATTITLTGANSITVNTKNTLIKTNVPQSTSTQTSSPSDLGRTYVKDLKRVEDTIKIRGWIEDDATTTAWQKIWKLRAMCSSGGALTSLVIEDVTFSSATQSAFLEEINFIVHPFPGKTIQTSSNKGVARIEVDLSFYLGDER